MFGALPLFKLILFGGKWRWSERWRWQARWRWKLSEGETEIERNGDKEVKNLQNRVEDIY